MEVSQKNQAQTNQLIIDLHCDLLCYLAEDKKRKPTDLVARCSLPQLEAGNVALQVFAIFSECKKSSTAYARKQVEAYTSMLKNYPEKIQNYTSGQLSSTTQSLIAIESAACLCTETDPLSAIEQNLKHITDNCGKPLYLSVTWNDRNRFGGGNNDSAGLSSDGEYLLHILAEQKIAIDLSHSSDPLCEGILSWIEKNAPTHPVIASHCVFKAVNNIVRNLHDDFAKEIINRDGLIGLNLINKFIGGGSIDSLKKHIEHGLKIRAQNSLCFGADFFYDLDFSQFENKSFYFEEFETAQCYPQLIETILSKSLTPHQVAAVCNQNVLSFLSNY